MTGMRMKPMLKRAYRRIFPRKDGDRQATAEFWDKTETALAPEYWANLQTIRSLVQERVTGSPDLAWFTKKVLERSTPFGRTLTFGDGHGMAAEAFQKRRDTSEIIAINVSAGEGKRFRATMELVAMDKPHRFVQADANTFAYQQLGLFDTIIDVGAFHHFEKFEIAFPRINEILKKDGRLYVDEFVGPTKYRFHKEVVAVINEWLRTLPASLIADRRPVTQADFIDLWKRGPDPSECVRSGDLDKALRDNFRLLECDEVGATLLQPFFLTSHLSPCRLNIANWHRAPEGREAAARLVKQEEDLLKKGVLTADYRYYVFTRKD
jgi:SAM-dependent methyltransferase